MTAADDTIRLRGICKAYDHPVLRDFSATLPRGGIVFIYGPSGVGKTTLIRIMMGLERPDSGTVTGVPARIACVFQEDRLLERLTVLDNLRLVSAAPEAELREGLAALFPEDGDILRRRASALSGGMRRRVALYRAFLAQADILFMDEPFKGMDPATKEIVISYIEHNRNGRTLIIVSHDEAEAARLEADRVLTLSRADGGTGPLE